MVRHGIIMDEFNIIFTDEIVLSNKLLFATKYQRNIYIYHNLSEYRIVSN
jgi:hypothetical protein